MHFSDNFVHEKGLESTKIIKIVLAWVNETRIFHEKLDIGQLHKKHFSPVEKTRIWTVTYKKLQLYNVGFFLKLDLQILIKSIYLEGEGSHTRLS